jgi:hypothetical protein
MPGKHDASHKNSRACFSQLATAIRLLRCDNSRRAIVGFARLIRPRYPDFLHGAPPTPACAAFIKESRMKSANAGKLNRKSGVRWCEPGAPVQCLVVPRFTDRPVPDRPLSIDGEKEYVGCRFLRSLFDVPVESGIHSEGDNDYAIHDADDPQGI